MKTFKELEASDCPNVESQKFDEWKTAVLRARRNTVVVVAGLILANVVLILISGTLVVGGLLLALLFVLVWYKAGRLQRELGIDKAAIKLAKARISTAGHMLATNLHADTYEQACGQICTDNGVSETSLRQMNLMLFLSVGPGSRRRIAEVWESDGQEPHERIFPAGSFGASRLVSPADIELAGRTVDRIMASGARTIEQVRAIVMQRHAGTV